MHRLLGAVGLIMTLALPAFGEGLSPEEQAAVEAAAREKITITSELVESEAVAQVFDAQFIKVQVRIKVGDGASTHKMMMLKKGDKITEAERTSSSRGMPVLLGAVKDDFRITDEASAKRFEAAMDKVYPITGVGDRKHKAMEKVGEAWHFYRGDFFDDLKGFVVTTDKAGKIAQVQYKLRIKKVQE